ncbi:hypothetical protein DRE_02106 [Drechslerella stenobrocha 248]|uniref:Glutaredoxin domain-containing protein n=1 Tax=Drechslerella stenobrocha 248 TaxID=1043628 RepID=W7I8D3_9PEZI|nr:hypothetical protein DRE_02106 [Drechslerella stenobrocha 248]
MKHAEAKEIAKAFIANNPVAVFSKSYCPFCTKAKRLLTELNVNFKAMELDVIENGSEIHAAVKEISEQNTVPCIYIGGKRVGGNDDLQHKHRTGELQKALRGTDGALLHAEL